VASQWPEHEIGFILETGHQDAVSALSTGAIPLPNSHFYSLSPRMNCNRTRGPTCMEGPPWSW